MTKALETSGSWLHPLGVGMTEAKVLSNPDCFPGAWVSSLMVKPRTFNTSESGFDSPGAYMARGLTCEAHTHTSNIPQERHHVWPLGYHGPNVKSNLITICCNAHSDIHYYMEYMLKHNGQVPPDWRTYGPKIREFANKGYEQVMAYGESLGAK